MNLILLSIVVPTKNRYKYLKAFIETCALIESDEFELVIQDNSDDNSEILDYLKDNSHPFVSYNYNDLKLSMSENSNLGVERSKGKYICFMGDDDLLSGKLIDFVKYMDRNNIDSASFNRASYYWPGVQFKVHQFPNLVIPNYSGRIKVLDAKKEYKKLLRRGATSLEKIPHLYHGVVKKEILDKIYSECGTFFPGPSPDIAVAVAATKFINKYVYCDMPLISSGVSPKSSAGLGAKHMHKGDLKSIPFLPDNIEEIWNEKIPKTWTGPTIYAESTFEAIRAVGLEGDIKYFNYPFFYAFFDIFCPDNKELSSELMKKYSVSKISYLADKTWLIFKRCCTFAKNIVLLKLHIGSRLIDNVENTAEAERIIDADINRHQLSF